MCGIAGLFSVRPLQAPAQSRIDEMVAALAHRGPDGNGTACFPNAALGHTRLAIIDIARGRQPMSDPTGRYTITYNGEIYNYRQLRATLSNEGYRFSSESDTEVVLALFATAGIDGFSRMRGMYAFAIWDQETSTGVLVRDPLGIKPLFYRDGGESGLRFASEAKAILAAEGSSATLDTAALHLLMNFRYLPGERTLFQGVRQLAPGAVMSWRAGQSRIQSVPWGVQQQAASDLDALQDSVTAHLTADVEVGCYLSGGIDSAAVAALAMRAQGRLRTFTLPIGDDPAEAANAARTATLLGVENLCGALPELCFEDLADLIWHLETPKVNAVQASMIARHTAEHVNVALSGLGGDELFYGYNMHGILHRLAGLARIFPGAATRYGGSAAASILRTASGSPWTEGERLGLMVKHLGNWSRVYGLLRNLWDSPGLRARIYGPRMLDAELPNAFDVLEGAWPANEDPVTAAADYEWRNKMVNDLLWQEDRVSMAVGLEVRVPFVDRVFHDRIKRLSRARLMAGGVKKAYMQRMLGELLPAEILRRPKSGFQIHAGRFFHEQLDASAKAYLEPAVCRRHGLFNPAFVADIRKLPPRTRWRWHYFMLYLILLTHVWLERFTHERSP